MWIWRFLVCCGARSQSTKRQCPKTRGVRWGIPGGSPRGSPGGSPGGSHQRIHRRIRRRVQPEDPTPLSQHKHQGVQATRGQEKTVQTMRAGGDRVGGGEEGGNKKKTIAFRITRARDQGGAVQPQDGTSACRVAKGIERSGEDSLRMVQMLRGQAKRTEWGSTAAGWYE